MEKVYSVIFIKKNIYSLQDVDVMTINVLEDHSVKINEIFIYTSAGFVNESHSYHNIPIYIIPTSYTIPLNKNRIIIRENYGIYQMSEIIGKNIMCVVEYDHMGTISVEQSVIILPSHFSDIPRHIRSNMPVMDIADWVINMNNNDSAAIVEDYLERLDVESIDPDMLDFTEYLFYPSIGFISGPLAIRTGYIEPNIDVFNSTPVFADRYLLSDKGSGSLVRTMDTPIILPKILHVITVGFSNDFSKEWARYLRSGWIIRTWNSENIDMLISSGRWNTIISKYNPNEKYHGLMIKLIILELHGGIAVDSEYYPTSAIPELVLKYRAIFGIDKSNQLATHFMGSQPGDIRRLFQLPNINPARRPFMAKSKTGVRDISQDYLRADNISEFYGAVLSYVQNNEVDYGMLSDFLLKRQESMAIPYYYIQKPEMEIQPTYFNLNFMEKRANEETHPPKEIRRRSYSQPQSSDTKPRRKYMSTARSISSRLRQNPRDRLSKKLL